MADDGWINEMIAAGAAGYSSGAAAAARRYEELQVKAFNIFGDRDKAAAWWSRAVEAAKATAHAGTGNNTEMILDYLATQLRHAAIAAAEAGLYAWRPFGLQAHMREVKRRTFHTYALVMFWQGPWWLRWLKPWKGRWIASIGSQEIGQRPTAAEAKELVDSCVER